MLRERAALVHIVGYVVLRENTRERGTVAVHVGEHHRYPVVPLPSVRHKFFYRRRNKFKLTLGSVGLKHMHPVRKYALLVETARVEQVLPYTLGLGNEPGLHRHRAAAAEARGKAVELSGRLVGINIGRAAHEYAATVCGCAHARLYTLRNCAGERLKTKENNIGAYYFAALFNYTGKQAQIHVSVQPAALL